MYANGGIPGPGPNIRVRDWACHRCGTKKEEWLDHPPRWELPALVIAAVVGWFVIVLLIIALEQHLE